MKAPHTTCRLCVRKEPSHVSHVSARVHTLRYLRKKVLELEIENSRNAARALSQPSGGQQSEGRSESGMG